MATVTLGQLVTDTREYMDAVGSTRWSDATIKLVLNNVFDGEWSSILNAAPYYRCGSPHHTSRGVPRTFCC